MHSQDPRHPVWQDFKHIKLRVDTTLTFQAGTGGNFLAGLMAKSWYSNEADLNQYNADCMFLWLDNQNTSISGPDIIYDREPESLYAIAKNVAECLHLWIDHQDAADHKHHCTLAIGHEPPYVTSQVFDFATDELIVIGAREQDAEVVEALRWYKHNFSIDYLKNVSMIPTILNQNRYQGKVNLSEYVRTIDMIRDQTTMDVTSTMFSWQYYLHCKADGLDPTAVEILHDYLCQNWLKPVQHRLWLSDYHAAGLKYCRANAAAYTELDYRDLFFRLQRPPRGALAGIDLLSIASYSQRNLDLLGQLALLALDQHKQRLEDAIADLSRDLAQAHKYLK